MNKVKSRTSKLLILAKNCQLLPEEAHLEVVTHKAMP